MNVLHTMTIIFPIKGIMEQLKSEEKAAQKNNLNWTVRSFGTFSNESEIFVKQPGTFSGLLSFRRDYYNWLNKAVKEKSYKTVLLRYQPYDISQFFFILRNRKKIRIYLVLHTLAIQEIESDKKLASYLKAFLEMLVGPLSFHFVHGLISVTREIGEKEEKRALVFKPLKKILYPNGILYNDSVMHVADTRGGSIPELLFIASSFAPWHGLDLLLKSMKNSKSDFVLHLVGNVPAEFSEAIKDERIVQHGLVDPAKIRELTTSAWVGLSSFAHFRLHMKQASTLKVREYLAYGLPVYATYEESFPADFPYFRNGDCNIDDIIQYAHLMRSESREKVSQLSRSLIDKAVLLKKLFEQL
jgi:glycosyltransferase involved in cell wall biosynthesis